MAQSAVMMSKNQFGTLFGGGERSIF